MLTGCRTAEDLNVTSSKLARYERLLNDIFPLVSTDVRNMIDDVRQQVLVRPQTTSRFVKLNSFQEFTSTSSLDQVDARSMPANAFELEERRTSSSIHRLPPPAPVPVGQSTPAFMPTPRSLPPPSSNDTSQSPMPSTSSAQRSSKSPPDDVSISSTIRLPSITRHGFLVEDGSRGQQATGPGSPGAEGQQPGAADPDGDLSRAGTSTTTIHH